MAFTDPTTVHVPATGQTAPATWGTTVNTDLNWLHDVPACSLHKSGAQSLSDSTETVITWETEAYDPEGMFTTSDSTSRITVPYTGIYLVTVSIEFAGDADGYRYVRIYKGAVLRAQGYEHGDSGGNHINFQTITTASAGDYFEITAEQSAGGALDIGGALFYQSHFNVALIRET